MVAGSWFSGVQQRVRPGAEAYLEKISLYIPLKNGYFKGSKALFKLKLFYFETTQAL
jgi:hypothetical protein